MGEPWAGLPAKPRVRGAQLPNRKPRRLGNAPEHKILAQMMIMMKKFAIQFEKKFQMEMEQNMGSDAMMKS